MRTKLGRANDDAPDAISRSSCRPVSVCLSVQNAKGISILDSRERGNFFLDTPRPHRLLLIPFRFLPGGQTSQHATDDLMNYEDMIPCVCVLSPLYERAKKTAINFCYIMRAVVLSVPARRRDPAWQENRTILSGHVRRPSREQRAKS